MNIKQKVIMKVEEGPVVLEEFNKRTHEQSGMGESQWLQG